MTMRYATISLRGDGSIRLNDGFISATHVSPGVYECVLVDAIGVDEACPIVTSWHPPAALPAARVATATILVDEVTLRIDIFDLAGVPTDGAFCCVLDRVAS